MRAWVSSVEVGPLLILVDLLVLLILVHLKLLALKLSQIHRLAVHLLQVIRPVSHLTDTEGLVRGSVSLKAC